MIGIVTGASSGMGADFCRSLDSEDLDCIWIVARRADRLEKLASELKTQCKVMALDLTDRADLDSLLDAISSCDDRISVLVNCAGMGRFGDSWSVSKEDTRTMIDLNVTALVETTRACIPKMGPGSRLVQVCSASAYLPLEQLNVYSASKAFVRSFCRGLDKELKGMGISVLEVSPGWVDTDFIPLSVERSKVPQKVFKHTVTSEQVVDQAMKDLRKGKKRSVCGLYNQFQVFVCTHFPSMASAVWSRSLR